MPTRNRARLSYQPALDGLRGVAVAAVLCFHSSMPWMRGGELGVDLFFVLSGFLITTLLLQEHASKGTIRLREFWARRVRRLFPALVLVLLAVAAYAAFVAAPSARSSIRMDSLASLTYWANWRFVFSHQPYFAHFGAPSPLRHVWSLSVEEQWYLFWPPALVVLLRVVRRRLEWILPVMVALMLASAGLMASIASSTTGIDRAYYGTDTRVQTLLAGAILAVVLQRWPVGRRGVRAGIQGIGLAAAAFCGWAMVTQRGDSHYMLHGGYGLFAIAGALVIAAVMMPRSGIVKSVLRVPPLVWLGRISYGLYLWHWPINVWLSPERVHLSRWPLFGLRTVVALAVSVASYHLVEQPIRHRRLRLIVRRPRVALASTVAGVVGILFVATILGKGGRGLVNSPNAFANAPSTTVPVNVTVPPTTVPQVPIPPVPPDRDVRVLMVGDSTAWTLGWALTPEQTPGLQVYDRAALGCGLLPDARGIVDGRLDEPEQRAECEKQDQRWALGLQENPDVVVMGWGAWELYDQQRADGTTLHVGTAKWRKALLDQFDKDVDFLNRYTEARIVLLDIPCYHEHTVALGGPTSDRNDPKRLHEVQSVFREAARRHASQVTVVPISQWVCPNGHFQTSRDGVVLRPDGVHIGGKDGPAFTWQNFLGPRISAIARSPKSAPAGSGRQAASGPPSSTGVP